MFAISIDRYLPYGSLDYSCTSGADTVQPVLCKSGNTHEATLVQPVVFNPKFITPGITWSFAVQAARRGKLSATEFSALTRMSRIMFHPLVQFDTASSQGRGLFTPEACLPSAPLARHLAEPMLASQSPFPTWVFKSRETRDANPLIVTSI